MNLLLINSGDENAFCALYDGAGLVVKQASDFADSTRRKQPDNLIMCLDFLANTHRAAYSEIKAIAVTTGPGSFTGMRVGLAIGKGAAAYLNIPLIPVTNFDLLFRRLVPVEGAANYCLLVPAKLPEYYYSLRTFEAEISAGTVDLENLGSIIGEKTAIVSDFCNESIQKHCYFAYLSGKDLKPEADSMLSLAMENFSAGRLQPPEKVEPLYMKDFIIKKHN